MLPIEASRLLTVLASLLITFGLYSQALQLWKSRSAKDFSPALIAALAVNELAWLNYGVGLAEWPIIFISASNLPAVAVIVLGYMRYGGDQRHAPVRPEGASSQAGRNRG